MNNNAPQVAGPTQAVIFGSREVRETVPDGGMKLGAVPSHNTLAEILASTVALGDSQVGV